MIEDIPSMVNRASRHALVTSQSQTQDSASDWKPNAFPVQGSVSSLAPLGPQSRVALAVPEHYCIRSGLPGVAVVTAEDSYLKSDFTETSRTMFDQIPMYQAYSISCKEEYAPNSSST